MSNLKIEYVSKEQLKPYAKNAKLHTDDQVEQIKRSIEEFGFNDPIAVWHDDEIIEGHGRLLAVMEMPEIETVPIIRLDDLTDEQRRAYMLVHNKLTMNTDFDFELLDSELDNIIDIDMAEFGFDIEIEDDEPEEIIDDEVPEEVETRCKLGDIWQLGNHRLICGDSTDPAVIDRLMDGVKADMVMTDAPYGINAVGNNGEVGANFGIAQKGKYRQIIADDTTETAQQAYDILSQICDKLILWGGNYFLDFLPSSDGWLIWDKRGESGIRNTFADGEMAWCSFHTPVRIYHQLWNGMIREGEHEKRVHPTQKPIKMLSEILQDFSKEDEIVLDVFGGSGSTLIACEQLNRKCYMCELDEHYCDVILQRYINFKGSDADVFLLKDGQKTSYSEV